VLCASDPSQARLPLYDGVLDIIHSVNSIKYIPPVEFEELIYAVGPRSAGR